MIVVWKFKPVNCKMRNKQCGIVVWNMNMELLPFNRNNELDFIVIANTINALSVCVTDKFHHDDVYNLCTHSHKITPHLEMKGQHRCWAVWLRSKWTWTMCQSFKFQMLVSWDGRFCGEKLSGKKARTNSTLIESIIFRSLRWYTHIRSRVFNYHVPSILFICFGHFHNHRFSTSLPVSLCSRWFSDKWKIFLVITWK